MIQMYNQESIIKINEDNEKLQMKNELLMKAIAHLEIENKKKDLIAMQLTKTIAGLNLKINKLEVK